MDPEKYLSYLEAADFLGVSFATLEKLVQYGRLTKVKIEGKNYIPWSEIVAVANSRAARKLLKKTHEINKIDT